MWKTLDMIQIVQLPVDLLMARKCVFGTALMGQVLRGDLYTYVLCWNCVQHVFLWRGSLPAQWQTNIALLLPN